MQQQSLFDSIPAPLPPAVVEKILDDDNLDEFFSDPDYAAPGIEDDPERMVSHTAAELNAFEDDYRKRVFESNRRWAMSS